MKPCHACPRIRGIVPPIGPRPARVMLIGENPSYEEDRRKEPFTGKTGIELRGTYLPILGIPASEIFITNACLCSMKGYVNPTKEQAMACASVHLGQQIAEVQPEIIVPMGAVACSLFPEIESMALQHGRAIPGRWGAHRFILFAMFHPSAGLRATGYMIAMMQDMDDLRKLLQKLDETEEARFRGDLIDWTPYPQDPHPTPDYRFIRNEHDLTDYITTTDFAYYCQFGDRKQPLGEDTESLPLPGKLGGGPPFCLTFSHTPGTGRLIYTRDRHLIDAYRKMLYELLPLQLFHNYLHDSDVYDELELPTEPFIDTMVRAYNLCLGGGGDDEEEGESRAGRGSLSLKVLAYRHCQMHMTTFKETVWPHSLPHILRWLKLGRSIVAPEDSRPPTCTLCGCPQDYHEMRGKTQRFSGPCAICPPGRCKKWSPPKKVAKSKGDGDKELNLLYRKLGTLITNVESGKVDKDGKTVDPWKRVESKEWKDDKAILVDLIGLPPLASIEHVPEPILLHYACRDADADLRLFLHMQHLQPWVFWQY